MKTAKNPVNVEQVKSDLINLFLSSYANIDEKLEVRILCIKHCAKLISKRTLDKPLRKLCKAIKYSDDASIIRILDRASSQYLEAL